MKPKRELIPDLSFGQNARFIMTSEGLTFRDVSKRAKVSQNTVYRIVERDPKFLTDEIVRTGKALGFTEKQIREKFREDRLARSKFIYSKKERLYQLIAEIVNLFDSKQR